MFIIQNTKKQHLIVIQVILVGLRMKMEITPRLEIQIFLKTMSNI